MRLTVAQQHLACGIDEHRGVVVASLRHLGKSHSDRHACAARGNAHLLQCRTVYRLRDAGHILPRWETRKRRLGEHHQLSATGHIGARNSPEHQRQVVFDLPVLERQLREFCLDEIPLSLNAAAGPCAVQIIVRAIRTLAIGWRAQAGCASFAGTVPK